MPNYQDIIKEATQTYLHSCDLKELKQALLQLDSVLSGTPNEENKANAECLDYRIRAKGFSILYFDRGYDEADYQRLEAFLTGAESELKQKPLYKNTARMIMDLRAAAQTVHSVMGDAAERIYQVRDYEGNLATRSVELLTETRGAFLQKLAVLESMPDTNDLFSLPEGAMFDIKTQACADVREVANWIRDQIRAISGEESRQFFESAIIALEDEPGESGIEYPPSLPEEDLVQARTTVLCSPLRDEVVLFLRAYARKNGGKYALIRTSAFEGKSESFLRAVFETLGEQGRSCVFFDAANYYGDNLADLFKMAIQYSKKNHAVFFVDQEGSREVYDKLYDIAKTTEGLSGMDVAYRYLTMPPFAMVAEELEERGIITTADYDMLRSHMAYMGYVGFNRIVMLVAQGKPWRDAVLDISERHEIDAARYLRNIPTQSQFMDAGWGDLGLERAGGKREREFDYDSVRSANPENVRRILDAQIELPAKCGMITRYCLLCGDDISAWSQLTLEEKTDRVNDATKLVAYLLQAQYQPEVEIVPKEKWEHGSAGGVCCGHGKRIQYREDCCRDYSWLVNAICHECYHAFQHTLVNEGWLPWHWEELHVSRNRPDMWRPNFDDYRNKPHSVYMNQIVEADARIFELDCEQQSDAIYHTINLE